MYNEHIKKEVTEMSKTYSETMELRACSCDMGGAWSPSAILAAMQETAGAHSALLGLDRNTMNSLGLAWVLSRVRVEFDRVPLMGETIRIETYPTPNRHMFYPRSHRFLDAAGNSIGRANSLWVLLDIESRRITNNAFVQSSLPDNSDLPMATGMPAGARPLTGEATVSVSVPHFTDLDVNHHVNNTKYLDWCCNALGIEVMRELCLRCFDVSYDAEIRPGDEIRSELIRLADSFSFCGFDADKRRFGISGKLSPR